MLLLKVIVDVYVWNELDRKCVGFETLMAFNGFRVKRFSMGCGILSKVCD